jgi:hypothetical protein
MNSKFKSLFSLTCKFVTMELGKQDGEHCATGTMMHKPPLTGKSSIINSLASMMRQEYPR